MSPLGEHFPAELLRPRIEAALKPGCVIKLLVKFPQITKQKFLVLVPSAIKGEVSPDVRSQIVAAVKFAKTITKDKKNRIIAALGA